MMTYFRLAFLLLLFHVTLGSDDCKCRDPTYTSTWGEFIPTTVCSGKCNGVQTGKQECNFNVGGIISNVTYCVVERECFNPDSCEGTWVSWSNSGSCRNCKQLQSRYCYKNGTFIRNNFCLGSKGSSEQNRTRSCSNLACPKATTTNRTPITRPRYRLPSTTSISTTTTTTSEVTATSFSRRVFDITGSQSAYSEPTISERVLNDRMNVESSSMISDSIMFRENLDAEPAESGAVVLVAILGSVGFISVASVVLGLAVVFSRRKKRKDRSVLKKHSAVPNPYSHKNDTYEAIGPALPERPPFRKVPAPGLSEQIYELPDKEKQTGKITQDTEHYLLPMTDIKSTSVYHEEDEIYYDIEANKKQ